MCSSSFPDECVITGGVQFYNFHVENSNNEGPKRQRLAGTLHVVAFVKRINMKEGSTPG